MDPNELEAQMRALDYFHSVRVLPGAWTVIRVDGRSFSRFTETGFEKPFDQRFHGYMVKTAGALLEELHGLYAYTESDEISVLFAHNGTCLIARWRSWSRSRQASPARHSRTMLVSR
jgi:tRNA(His) 5'-end guanylyltransferase